MNLAAERGDLLLGGGAHVGRGDDRAEARAVAIACRPATPAPMTKTRAAGTVPAAVIIIGMARSYSAAASITADSRRDWPGWTARPSTARG
jgi:hypothetical protein